MTRSRGNSYALATVALAALGAVSFVSAASGAAGDGKIAFRRYLDQQQTWSAVFTMKPDGSGVNQVTHPPRGTVDDQPVWSADGKRLLFTRCSQGELCHTYFVQSDGSGVTPIGPVCPAGAVETSCADEEGASLSPDAKLVALIASTGEIKRDPSGEHWIQHSALTVMGLDGSGRRLVYRGPAYSGDLMYPVFSPNGKQLVFERTSSGFTSHPDTRAVFVVNLDGSGLKQLTPWPENSGDNPDWSSDGKWILFHSHVDDPVEQGQIVVVHPDGTGRTQITHFPVNTHLASASFAPNGRSIALGKGPENGNIDVWTIGVDGSGLTRLTKSPLWESAPDWGSA